MKLGVIILAAGQGTRMKSSMPKVLHGVAGKPMVSHVIDTAKELGAEKITLVYGHGGDQVQAKIQDDQLEWVEQADQLGTGHAVEQALPNMLGMDRVLVLYGDVPLTSQNTLQALIDLSAETSLALLTVQLDNPSGYGRIVRDKQNRVLSIVEQKDATDEQLLIQEINSGILIADGDKLQKWIGQLENSNAQGEFYLTDIVAMAVNEAVQVQATQAADLFEVSGVNDRVQLATLERHYQKLQAEQLMRQGVTLIDPARLDVRGQIEVAQDVTIDVNVILEGKVTLGQGVRIGANTVIRDSQIADGVTIKENCVIENAQVGAQSVIGPFARLRPETRLGEGVHIGNFVEIKKTVVDTGSKINHLSYVGDALVGKAVNIGAGTITCNYDGANKFQTVIEDRAFIGSDTQLVAPVTVAAGATIGAGSTITRDAPAETLTFSRAKQTSLKSWARPVKKPKS